MTKTKTRFVISKSKFDAVIFDLDGVITQSAKIHAKAWKEMFDDYLSVRSKKEGVHYDPFNIKKDYDDYVDGKPRYDGVKSFLQARGIKLPYGSPEDSPNKETICGLGNRKNALFAQYLRKDGVDVYKTSVELVHTLRANAFKVAIVSSSKNCSDTLKSAE